MEKMDSYELAERYVLGYLSPEEKEYFENEMLQNPDLKKEVDLLNGISVAIQDEDLLEFRTMVHEEAVEYKVSRRGLKVRRVYIRASAAAASIILVAATIFVLSLQSHRPASSAKVYSQYYSPYHSGLVSRSGSGNEDELYSRAVHQYSSMQYKSATELFDSILLKDPGNNGALFFSGLAYMELKEFPKASQRFESIILNANSLYLQQAEWYRGLTLLVMNDRKNAVVQFKNLVSSKGFYTAKARLILDELKGN
jgi:tetratricopeptide (TPR) repeat protein